MTTIISQTPIALGNSFSPLEIEIDSSMSSSDTTMPELTDNIRQDDDLDLSTWCVVDSSCSSDDEGEEEPCEQDGDEEIYLWHPLSAPYEDQLPPLRLSSSDGFTHISKAATAHSINSASATAPEHKGTWVVKVNKKRTKFQEPELANPISSEAPECSNNNPVARLKSIEKLNTSEKRKDTSSNMPYFDESEVPTPYMSMTEHELSKSSKAAKIWNNRVASQHEHDLAKALRCLSEETDKVDKKAVKSRSNCKSKPKSNKALKSKIISPDL